jgi:dihydroneopterin aldolase
MRIELIGLEIHGHHGVLEHERRDGQRFLFDLELELARTPHEDRIEDAQDYREAVAIVRKVSGARAYQLLEALASDLADALLTGMELESVMVRVCKPDVDLGVPVRHAAVVVERRRDR